VEITEVRVSLKDNNSKKLKAYVTVTFDNSFVVRNIKVIEGNSGVFVAMPTRKAKQFCPRCGKRIDMGSKYCSYCGSQLPLVTKDNDKNAQQIHQDIAHPINQEFRDYLQKTVLEAYQKEKEASKSGSNNSSLDTTTETHA